jgi:hypothetical protein
MSWKLPKFGKVGGTALAVAVVSLTYAWARSDKVVVTSFQLSVDNGPSVDAPTLRAVFVNELVRIYHERQSLKDREDVSLMQDGLSESELTDAVRYMAQQAFGAISPVTMASYCLSSNLCDAEELIMRALRTQPTRGPYP